MIQQSRHILDLPKEILYDIAEHVDEHRAYKWKTSIFALMRVNRLFRDIVVDINHSQSDYTTSSHRAAIFVALKEEYKTELDGALFYLYYIFRWFDGCERHFGSALLDCFEQKHGSECLCEVMREYLSRLHGAVKAVLLAGIPLRDRLKYTRILERLEKEKSDAVRIDEAGE